jgi:hypothetical protein
MRKSLSDRAREVAVKYAAETLGKDAEPRLSFRTAVAEDGRVIHRVAAVDRNEPNGTSCVLLLDDDGNEVNEADLSASTAAALGGGLTRVEVPPVRAVAAPAAGATIDPTTNDLVLELGETETEIVTVRIPAMAGVAKADVYLLADTTGSMGPVIAAVQAGANAIVGANYGAVDIAFGVGNYRDLPGTNPPFVHQLNPDTNAANVVAAINAWVVGGGGDQSEGQLYALHILG